MAPRRRREDSPDYLVAEPEPEATHPPRSRRSRRSTSQVQVVDQAGFYQLVNPTAEEFLEILRSEPRGHEFWSDMQTRLWKGGVVLDLAGTDFRNRAIEGTLYKVCLDNCDFRGAKIAAYFDKVKGARYDGAIMTGGSFSNAEDCTLKHVTMNDVRWNPAVFVRCNFTGAKLAIRIGSYTTATECIFKKADLSGADLNQSKFPFADFSGASLTDAKLERCDFTGANLAGADLSRSDLRNTKFGNADLRKAKFKDAILSGADLTGATIDGADFTGANVTGMNLTGLDLAKAKNLEQKAARSPGPNMRDLTKVATASKRFLTTIELDLGKDEFVVLQPGLSCYANQAYPSANHSHHFGNSTFGNYVQAPTFEQAMLNLTDLWSRGTPKFDTVKVDAKKCPLRGKELRNLAIAAWHEACGLEVPTADALQRAAVQKLGFRGKSQRARGVMIAELVFLPALPASRSGDKRSE